MPRWTVGEPTTLDFDGVVALRVRVVSGSVAVLAIDERPRLEVSSVTGPPLLVTHEAGILTVSHQDFAWDRLTGWLSGGLPSASVTVAIPRGCPAHVSALSAATVVSGVAGKTFIKSMSGAVTLDGVTGRVRAATVSGDVEAEGLAGRVSLASVSGDVALAKSLVENLDAKTVSGRVTADLDVVPGSSLRISTVLGPVTVRLPASVNARVDLRSTAGRVRSEFTGLGDGTGTGGAVSGKLGSGSGSGRLSVASISGQVTLLEHAPPAEGAGAKGGTS